MKAMLNREVGNCSEPRANSKRIYRVMKQAGLPLERNHGKSTRTHQGSIITLTPPISEGVEKGAVPSEMPLDLRVEAVETRFGAIEKFPRRGMVAVRRRGNYTAAETPEWGESPGAEDDYGNAARQGLDRRSPRQRRSNCPRTPWYPRTKVSARTSLIPRNISQSWPGT